MALGTHFAFNEFYSSQDAQKYTTVPFIDACIKQHLHSASYFSFTLGIYSKQCWEAMKHSHGHGAFRAV